MRLHIKFLCFLGKIFIPLSANPEKWSNTLKQIVGNLPTICLSVFDHFMNLALKGLLWRSILCSFVAFSAVAVDTQPLSLNISNKVPQRFSFILLSTVPIRINENKEMALISWTTFTKLFNALFNDIESCLSKFIHFFLILIKDCAPNPTFTDAGEKIFSSLLRYYDIIITTVVLASRTLGLTILWYNPCNISFNSSYKKTLSGRSAWKIDRKGCNSIASDLENSKIIGNIGFPGASLTVWNIFVSQGDLYSATNFFNFGSISIILDITETFANHL